MRYIPHTEKDIKKMLAEIGVQNIDELFDSIPGELRLEKPLNLPQALAESELAATLKRMQSRNLDPEEYSSFLGGGAYRHFIPSVVNHILSRSEFSTSYTPYQPEVSQGTLQAIFEFQTMICLLTGMDVANASMYDGASALAEAVLMAYRINGKSQVMISRAAHPQYRQVVNTYLQGNGLKVIEVPFTKDGKTDLQFIANNMGEQTSSVVIQNPNYFGVVEEYGHLDKKEAMLIVSVVEALSLGILKPPGERGADIVSGEGQSFGLPVSYGGPYVGFFATRQKHARQIPGRLAGQTIDRLGNRAYALTLATREQHIRRDKATSNICTNHGLCALAATVYMTLMGKKGLRELAEINLKKTDYLKNKLAKLKGYTIPFGGDTFNEFALQCPRPANRIQEKLIQEKILAGHPLTSDYPELENSLIISATETNTVQEMDSFVEKLEGL